MSFISIGTNFTLFTLTLGSSGDLITGSQCDFDHFSSQSRKHRSSSTKHEPKLHHQDKGKHRRRSLQMDVF